MTAIRCHGIAIKISQGTFVAKPSLCQECGCRLKLRFEARVPFAQIGVAQQVLMRHSDEAHRAVLRD